MDAVTAERMVGQEAGILNKVLFLLFKLTSGLFLSYAVVFEPL